MDPIYEAYQSSLHEAKIPSAPDLSKEKEYMQYWVIADNTQLMQMDNVFRGNAAWIRVRDNVAGPKDAIVSVIMKDVKKLESFFKRQGIEVEETRKMKFEKYHDTPWDDHGHTVNA